jgi:hypothetical protein
MSNEISKYKNIRDKKTVQIGVCTRNWYCWYIGIKCTRFCVQKKSVQAGQPRKKPYHTKSNTKLAEEMWYGRDHLVVHKDKVSKTGQRMRIVLA